MKRMILMIFVSAIAMSSFAQDLFVVYSVKGGVTTVKRNKTIPVKAGETFTPERLITIADNAGITFICKDGSCFSVTTPGNYSPRQFIDSCHKNNSQMLDNFFKFLYVEATTKSSALPGKARRRYFSDPESRTGPVNPVWIDRKTFDTINYSGTDTGTNVGLNWKSYTNEKEHEFSLYSATNITTPIYKSIVGGLRIPFIALVQEIKPGNRYYWTVNRKGEDETGWSVLNYVTRERYDSVLTNISHQKPTLEGPAEEAYRTAFMLEYSHYLAEAYQYYFQAAFTEAANPLYISTLVVFKKEFGLSKN